MDFKIKELLNSDKLLTQEDEYQIFTYYYNLLNNKNLDLAQEVKQLFLVKNMNLVHKVVSHCGFTHFDNYDDLFNEGMIGLTTAFERFNHELNYKFSTYAVHWISQAIGRYNSNCGRTIRIPVHVEEKYFSIKKIITKYNTKYNREPSVEELMKATSYSRGEIEHILTVFHIMTPASLNSIISEEHGEATELGDFITDYIDHAENIEKKVDMEYFRKLLKDILPDREYDVIKKRFGFDCEPMTLEEIAHLYGLTRERIRQIEGKAIKRIRQFHNLNKIQDFREYVRY